jgi:hypothetical protein
LYAAWQDSRSGDYDIYVAHSNDGGQTWQEAGGNPVNDDLTGANQLNPSLSVSGGTLYLAWQDERNGQSHIYFARSMDGGEHWDRNVFVSDDPESPEVTEQWQTAPALVVYHEMVYVTWEDEYGDDPSDIYYVWGRPCDDPGCDNICFDVPIRVNDDALGSMQRQPDMAAHVAVASVRRTETIPDPENPAETIEVECYDAYEGTALHFVWQDFRAEVTDPDIYYAWAFDLDFDFAYGIDLGLPIPRCVSYPGVDNPFGVDHEILGNKKVNSGTGLLQQPADDGCYHPQDEAWGDYQGALWQEHPTILIREGGVYGLYGVYIAWADGWVFDDYWNYDLWLARTYRVDVESGEYLIADHWVVNDNAKLYGYLNAEDYAAYGPAQSRQGHPTLAYCAGLPCVAWDDNRRGDPLAGGICNHDIYFTRPGPTPTEGVYLSPIFDADSTDAVWYVIDWWATTPYCGRLVFQTRLGNTPWPDGEWTQWTGAVNWDGDWVYDAPGQHIMDEAQNPYPRSRYIQYKARLFSYCGSGGSPNLQSVTLYHNHSGYGTLLPLIWR